MNKKEKEIIKSTIDNLLEIRHKEMNRKTTTYGDFIAYEEDKGTTDEDVHNARELYIAIENELIKLNSLLNIEDKNQEVIDIEQQMKKIQVKKYITTDEMKEIYNISISSQKDYRGRLNDPLPFTQKKFRGKIIYVVEDIEKWLKSQNK